MHKYILRLDLSHCLCEKLQCGQACVERFHAQGGRKLKKLCFKFLALRNMYTEITSSLLSQIIITDCQKNE